MRTAGDDIDQAIIAWMKKEYSLMLGERTAEEMKMTLGSAFPLPTEPEAEIRGRDMVSGLPRTVVVSSAELRKAIEEPLHSIVDAVRATLDQTPPELAGDIMDRGIVLTGGGALLRGLDERLRHETGMPVHVAEEPLSSVAFGAGTLRRGVRGAPAGARVGSTEVLMRGHGGRTGGRGERRWRGLDRLDDRSRPPRSLLLALVLASVTLMTLDHQVDDGSPVESARRAVGEAFGPVESFTSGVVRPFTAVPSWFHTKTSLRSDIRDLEAENAELREQVATSGFDRNRLEEFEGLTRTADDLGRALVPARVVAYGSSQSFSNTVTIDAGSAAGVQPRHDRRQQRRPGRPGAARHALHRDRAARRSTPSRSWAAGWARAWSSASSTAAAPSVATAGSTSSWSTSRACRARASRS